MSAFSYPVGVYIGNSLSPVIVQTNPVLPMTGSNGECILILNSTSVTNGFYVWLDTTWVLALDITNVSVSSIFRNALNVYIKQPYNLTVDGTVYENGVLSGSSIITTDNSVFINLLPPDSQTAQTVLAVGSTHSDGTDKQLSFTGYINTGIGIDNTSYPPSMQLGNLLTCVLNKSGITVDGNIQAIGGFNSLISATPQLGISLLALLASNDGNTLISHDGGNTYATPSQLGGYPYILADNDSSNVINCSVGTILTLGVVFNIATTYSSVIVTGADSRNIGCLITDLGVSNGSWPLLPNQNNVNTTYKMFSITVQNTVANAFATFTLGSLTTGFNLKILT